MLMLYKFFVATFTYLYIKLSFGHYFLELKIFGRHRFHGFVVIESMASVGNNLIFFLLFFLYNFIDCFYGNTFVRGLEDL